MTALDARVAAEAACRKIRGDILAISHASGHGHIPTCFSVVEQIYAVYQVMRHDPKNPGWAQRDRFVLSKGHAALAHYCVLASQGYFDVQDVYSFGHFGSTFGCHADRTKVPGIEVSTGSLGHGIAVAAGMALGARIRGKTNRVFTLVGDGESNEGSVWEAVMVAADLNLTNLTIIVDYNKSQTRCLQIDNVVARFASFGCDAELVNAHDLPAMAAALSRTSDRVRVIVADAKKGYGCRTLETNFHEWHRRSPDAATLKTLMEELNA